MSKTRPTLRNQTLMLCDGDEFNTHVLRLRIESEQWFLWLEENSSFRAEISVGRAKAILSLRKEINGRHKTAYWYAYAKVEGKTKKKYLGQSSELSFEKLQHLADYFLHEI